MCAVHSPRGKWRLGAAVAGMATLSAAVFAAVVADSVDDWSAAGVQGEKGWYSGYYDETADADGVYTVGDFVMFNREEHWNGSYWALGGNPPWTMVGPETSHPNGTNCGSEHWAIRRWLVDRDGDMLVSWWLRKQSADGSGVTGVLFLNDMEVDKAAIAGTDLEGIAREIHVAVEIGDRLDLAHTPRGPSGERDDRYDGSFDGFRVSSALAPVHTGDANADGKIDIADAVCILGHLFGQPGDPCKNPACAANMDANDDARIDIADAVTVLSFLFAGAGMKAPDGNTLQSGNTRCARYPAAEVTLLCARPCVAR